MERGRRQGGLRRWAGGARRCWCMLAGAALACSEVQRPGETLRDAAARLADAPVGAGDTDGGGAGGGAGVGGAAGASRDTGPPGDVAGSGGAPELRPDAASFVDAALSRSDGAGEVADAAPEGATRDAGSLGADAGSARRGVFVAVGYGGRTTRSVDDGRTWINDTSLAAVGADDDNLLRTVLWGDGRFVALGWRVLTSVDGQTWSRQGGVMSQWIGAAGYAKGRYVAVGGYGLRWTSTDAVTWQAQDIDQTASHAHGGLAYGDVLGGRWVATNDDGRRSFATDGSNWQYSAGATGVATTALAYGDAVFVGIGAAQVVLSRDGGASWSLGARLAAPADALLYASGRFTAIGAGHVFTSADGVTWEDHPVRDLVGGPLAYGNGTYVMVVDTTFRRSRDGLVWEAPIAVGGRNAYEWVAYGTP